MRKIAVAVLVPHGDSLQFVSVQLSTQFVRGDFAVTRPVEISTTAPPVPAKKGWRVTHIPSGMALTAEVFRTAKGARLAAELSDILFKDVPLPRTFGQQMRVKINIPQGQKLLRYCSTGRQFVECAALMPPDEHPKLIERAKLAAEAWGKGFDQRATQLLLWPPAPQ